METTTMNANDVKKELYKSKVNAKLSHYTSGNVYYTVELADGTYQFPISTIDKVELEKCAPNGLYIDSNDYNGYERFNEKLMTTINPLKDLTDRENFEEIKFDKLSADLGTTSFYSEMKGSDLNRWIMKAIERGEFVKVG